MEFQSMRLFKGKEKVLWHLQLASRLPSLWWKLCEYLKPWQKPKENVMSGTHLELDGTESIPIVLLEKKSNFIYQVNVSLVINDVFPLTYVSQYIGN